MHKNCARISHGEAKAGEELWAGFICHGCCCHCCCCVGAARKVAAHTGRFIGGSGDAHKGVFLSIFLVVFPFMCFEKMSKRSAGRGKYKIRLFDEAATTTTTVNKNNLLYTHVSYVYVCVCVDVGVPDLCGSRMAHIICVELEILYAALGCVYYAKVSTN